MENLEIVELESMNIGGEYVPHYMLNFLNYNSSHYSDLDEITPETVEKFLKFVDECIEWRMDKLKKQKACLEECLASNSEEAVEKLKHDLEFLDVPF